MESPWAVVGGGSRVGPHLELVPLDAADAARRVPPGLLGAEGQLGLPQPVRARGRDVGGHLPQPLRVCRAVLPAGGPSAPAGTASTPQHPQTPAPSGVRGPSRDGAAGCSGARMRLRDAPGQGWGIWGCFGGEVGIWGTPGRVRSYGGTLACSWARGVLWAGMGLGVLCSRDGFLGCPRTGIRMRRCSGQGWGYGLPRGCGVEMGPWGARGRAGAGLWVPQGARARCWGPVRAHRRRDT